MARLGARHRWIGGLAALVLGAMLAAPGCGGEPAPEGVEPPLPPTTPPPSASPDGHERNAQGFRDDHDYVAAKPEGVERVMILGDSMAFGWNVDLKDGLAEQIEKRLPSGKGDARRWEVLNLSQPAFNTMAEVALLRNKGLAYDPDVVVLVYYLDDALSGQETELGDISQTTHLLALSVLGTLDGADQKKVQAYLDANGWGHALDDAKAAKLEREQDAAYFVAHDLPLYWQPTVASLQELASLAKSEGFRVVVAIVPAFTRPADGYPFRPLHERVAGEMGKLGFTVVDFLPLLSEHPSDELAQIGGFPTPKGHALMAEGLVPEIVGQAPPAGH